ncbi:hypothetical protein V4V60_003339 [Vibrio mimicus]|uniref:hypothetical protein n=1 Tax=Vibrio TaxID=662 RepID=UPI0005FACD62|nr:hypothetical protein [Vibrio vulnificus]ELX4199072.1 hypothetical protein [Vibrio vulnificus]HCG9204191.1 hypothetical protein [Vibrio parahaemolyticus]
MNTIKHHTLFVNGALTRFQHSNGDWSSFYSIDNIRLKNNNTDKDSLFISEQDKKLMKSLAEHGYSKKGNKSRYDSIARRLSKFYKRTFTEKADWKHIVDTTGGVLKIWLTNTDYDRHQKRVSGDIALFRENDKNQIELILYTDSITTRFGKEDGRYHDFSKAGGYKSFTHHLEMEKQELRTNTYIKKLREDATLKENTKHNNDIVNAHNNLVDALDKQQQLIEKLQQELMELKQKAA